MKTNNDLILPATATMADYQKYVQEMEEIRGFAHETILQDCLMLGEEVGELFKAIRKAEGLAIDKNSKVGLISDELADCFIFLCSIANKYNISLEKAFLDKEEINKKRVWGNSI